VNLKADPNPLPGKAELSGAIKGLWACFDEDGLTHCAPEPDRIEVYSFRCKQIPPGDKDFPVRAACRVNGAAFSKRHSSEFPSRRMASFREECLRLDRFTEFGRSPAAWIVRYIPDSTKCEVD
jgi:hypothetical protein